MPAYESPEMLEQQEKEGAEAIERLVKWMSDLTLKNIQYVDPKLVEQYGNDPETLRSKIEEGYRRTFVKINFNPNAKFTDHAFLGINEQPS